MGIKDSALNSLKLILILPGFSYLGIFLGGVNMLMYVTGVLAAFLIFFLFWFLALQLSITNELVFQQGGKKLRSAPIILRYLLSPLIDLLGAFFFSLVFRDQISRMIGFDQATQITSAPFFHGFTLTLGQGLWIHIWFLVLSFVCAFVKIVSSRLYRHQS